MGVVMANVERDGKCNLAKVVCKVLNGDESKT